MTITYRYTFLDRLAFAAYHMSRNPLILIMLIGTYLYFTFEAVVPATRSTLANVPETVKIISFVIVEFLLALFLVAILAVMTLLAMISRRNKTIFCVRKITLADETFAAESPYGKSETRWQMVQKLARTRRYIFMYLNQESAVVIPRRAFENSSQWDAFYDVCREKTNRAT